METQRTRALRVAAIGRTGRGDWGHAIDQLWQNRLDAKVVAVADDSPENIRSRSGSCNVVDLSIHKVQAEEVKEKLKSIAAVEVVEVLGEEQADPVHVRVTPREKVNILPNISELVKKENWTLDALHQERGRLDEVFRDLTEGDV